MFRFYPPVLILQVFCLYHAYKNNAHQKWFWLIIFLPLIGSLIYLYQNFYTRRNIENLSETVKHVMNSNYKIEQLEKQLTYSDTVSNKIQLADEYAAIGNYERAHILYTSCLEGMYKDDVELLKKLVRTSYLQGDYELTAQYGTQIKSKPTFRNAEERVFFAWALYKLDRLAEAEENFEQMDAQFSNYSNRLEFAKFLKATDRTEESKEKLNELLSEIDSMNSYEKRLKKGIKSEIISYSRSF